MSVVHILIIFVAKLFATNIIAMKSNPFKFGTLVSDPYFTDREKEIKQVESILNSANHLIIIGPRRFGKTSLVFKAMESIHRPILFVDMQLINSSVDLASQLLKKVFRNYPSQKLRTQIRNFRIVPSLTINPISNEIEVMFNPFKASGNAELEDVLNLIDQLGKSHKKPVIILDEFQEVFRIDKNLIRQLRSIMQTHQNCNYVFLGSQESMIREIFEKKKSPFYHFGIVLALEKIPAKLFSEYLSVRLTGIAKNPDLLAKQILEISGSHPYFTQQLAFFVWEVLSFDPKNSIPVDQALDDLIRTQDHTYERLFNTLNTTDRKLMIGMVQSDAQPMSKEFSPQVELLPVSTIYSSLKRLVKEGYLLKNKSSYSIDDVFFKIWLIRRLKG